MAKKKQLGHKCRVSIDGSNVGFLMAFTPPDMSRSEVEATDMESTLVEYLDSDPPEFGLVKLTLAWDPADTGDVSIDDIFLDEDPTAREVPIVLMYHAALKKDTFNGRIMKITPAQVKQKELMARDVEIRPTSKPVRSAYTPPA